MTTNYHTPIPTSPKQPASAAIVDAPLAQLDQAITNQAALISALDARADALEADMPVPSGDGSEYLDGDGNWTVPAGTGSTNGHVIQDEGVDLPQRTKLNFVGAGVAVTNEAGGTQVTVNGGGDMAKSTYDPDENGVIAVAQGGTGGATQADARLGLGLGTAAVVDIDTDTTLAANSDTKVASQKAVKAYADALIAANDAMVYKGVIDCSANPNYPAADRGHSYRVSVAGKIGGGSGTNVEVGDLLICLTDGTLSGTQAGVGSSWSIVQSNIDGAVIGPASSVSGNIATFSGTTGKNIQDSGKALPSGTIVGTSDTQTLTAKRLPPRLVTVTASATPSINTDNGDIFTITGLNANITSLTSGLTGTPNDGETFQLRVTDDSTPRTITPGASFIGTAAFSLSGITTTAGKILILIFQWNATLSKWVLVGKDSVL